MIRKLLLTSIIFTLIVMVLPMNAQRVQAIHGSADPVLDPADVYVQVQILQFQFDDIPFRSAGETFDSPVPLNLEIFVGIAPGNSQNANDTLVNFSLNLESNKDYIGVFRGVADPSQYAPNPDGLPTGLSFSQSDEIRQVANTPGNTEFIFVHTATDAPTVDLYLSNGTQLADNIPYGGVTSYISLAATQHEIEVRDASGTNLVRRYSVDFAPHADSAIVVMASGFLDPSQNQNGPAFNLIGFLADGDEIDFTDITTSIDDDLENRPFSDFELRANYPNPFNPATTIEFVLPQQSSVSLQVYNALGEMVDELVAGQLTAGQHRYQWDAGNRSSGIYYYRLVAGNFSETRKMVLMR